MATTVVADRPGEAAAAGITSADGLQPDAVPAAAAPLRAAVADGYAAALAPSSGTSCRS